MAKESPQDSTHSEGSRAKTSEEAVREMCQLLNGFPSPVRVVNDAIFKHLLGEPGKSEKRLVRFINAVLKQTEQPLITDVTIEHSENFPDAFDGKIAYLDLLAKDEHGTAYHVEVQIVPHDHFISRMVYYLAHGSQLSKGSVYSKIRPTISIVLTEFDLFPGRNTLFDSFLFRSTRDPDFVLTHDLQLHFIQLKNILSTDSMDGIVKELSDWMLFLNCPFTKESDMINVSNSDPTFYDAVQDINTFVSDPAHRRVIEAIERDRRDRVDIRESGLREGYNEGFAKGEASGEARGRTAGLAEGEARGRAAGLAEGRMAVASKMKRLGLDVSSISQATGLSAEEY